MQTKFIGIGASLGGTQALQVLLPMLPPGLPAAVTVVLHHAQGAGSSVQDFLCRHSRLDVEMVEDKTPIRPGKLYFAPAGYHILVEDHHFALSLDALVSHARPSIDVLFDSAAEVFGSDAIGIVLTGAGYDGAQGISSIKRHGGLTITQTPETAECESMPKAALATTMVDIVLDVDEIVPFLVTQ